MVRTIVELNNFIKTCMLNDCETPKNIKTFVLVYENILLSLNKLRFLSSTIQNSMHSDIIDKLISEVICKRKI